MRETGEEEMTSDERRYKGYENRRMKDMRHRGRHRGNERARRTGQKKDGRRDGKTKERWERNRED